MNYVVINGKSLLDGREAQTYIDWALMKLEQGFETDAIVSLVSLMLQFFPDVDCAEDYFKTALNEIGLPDPDVKTAVHAYLQHYCDQAILGHIEAQQAIYDLEKYCEIISFKQELNVAYHSVMDVLSFLITDLEMICMDEPALYNTGLTILNCDAYLLQIIWQFQTMLYLQLPQNFIAYYMLIDNELWSMKDYRGRCFYLQRMSNEAD